MKNLTLNERIDVCMRV